MSRNANGIRTVVADAAPADPWAFDVAGEAPEATSTP